MLRLATAADIVVVLRKTFPGPLLWLLRRVSRRLVFDFDDAIFCNSDGTPSSTRMRRFAAMARACDHLLAGNGFLAGNGRRHNPAVTWCRPASTAAATPATTRSRDSFDLVWIGSRSTRKYLVEALPALRLAAARGAAPAAEDHRRLRPARLPAWRPWPSPGAPTEARNWAPRTSASPRCATTTGAAASAR
jgi:hypothetical protein